MATAFLVPLDAAVVGQRAEAATCASANLTVTPLASPIFYADFSPSPPSLPNLAGHYTGYRITNTAGTAVNNAWVKLSNFTGGIVGLAPGEAAFQPLANLAPSGSGRSYFYLSASAATALAQAHTVSVYDRRPDLAGAVELCNTSFTFTSVTSTTQAAANKVTIATATSNPPGLGAQMTMTVTGDTGTIGNGPASDPKGFDMTPAAVASGASAWTPAAYRLLSATLNVDLTGGGATTSSDFLHYTFTDPSSSDRAYTATYVFVIVGTTSTSAALTPIQYIASGTQIKHTDMSGSTYSAILPIQPISNTTTIAKSASPTALTTPGGTVNYTVTATNSSGTQNATLDDFTDTPGAGATYVAGSSRFNGTAIGDPLTSGSTLVWSGAFAVPAATSRSLTYNMAIVSGVGTVSNSVIGHVGASVIDTTTSTADNVPASSSITVAAAPTLNLTKAVGSRLSATDQFTVAIKNGASTVASATTSGAGTSASTGAQTLASGTTYSLTDTMATGSANAISQYVGTITCTNAASGSATVLPSGSSAPFSITPVAGDVIACSIANAPVPTLTLVKSVSGRIISADQFTVAIKNGAATVASATTAGTDLSATTGSTALAAGTSYTLTDVMAAGSTSAITAYTSGIACTNSAGGSATLLPSGTGTSFNVTPAAGDAITCTFTNTVPAPTLTLIKSLSSRHDATDQFTVAITHGAGPTIDASHTTSGVLLGGSTASTTLTAGTTYTLTDDVTAGSSANADYDSSISCTNSTTGTGTTLPSGAGNSFGVTPQAGDAIVCTFTNRAKPRVALLKSVAGRVNGADQFRVAITHGAVTDASATTSGAGVSATTGVVNLNNGTPYTLTDAMAAGSISTISAYLNSISCANARAGSATVLPSGSGTSFSLNPAFDDQITCTITNTAKPHLTLVASVGSRAVAADQFTVSIKDGASTVASATTAGASSSATTGITGVSSGTTYTLTDAMAGGSPSVLAQYASSISCSNAKAGSATVLPSGTGTSFSVVPTNGDVISCTITNTAGTASLGLTKTTPSTNVGLGNVITYTFGVTNAGSLPLTNVTVTDPMVGLSVITCAPVQGSTLASGATMSCTATYTVTQADVDAGSIMNTGTVTGKDPSNNTITNTASETVAADQTPALDVTKVASPSSGVVAGDIVTYTVTGTNIGTVTLTDLAVSDPMVDLSAFTCTPPAGKSIDPGEIFVCTATYKVTQADIDAGSIDNTARVDATFGKASVFGSASATVTTGVVPQLTVTKLASPNTDVNVGEAIEYVVVVENTGSVTVDKVEVTDPLPGLSAFDCSPPTPTSMAPGDTMKCVAKYTVTQADVDAGHIDNTATASGYDPEGNPVSFDGSTTVTTYFAPSISLTKTPSPAIGVVAGDIVTYSLSAQNTGNVTLHDIDVTDPMSGLSALTCAPVSPATLAPGEAMDCSATYTVTQADVDNSATIANHATIDALDPFGNATSNFADAVIQTDQNPALSIVKTASPNAGVVPGDTITYQFAVSNPGTVTIDNVTVTDPLPGLGPITCAPAAPATLAPAATMSCSATYTVTQANVDAGSIMNTATVAGDDPSGAPISNTGGTTVTADQATSLSLTKSVSPNSNVVAGDVVTYTFTATNTGSVSIDNANVTDPMGGLSVLSCTPTQGSTLAANAKITCTATYTVTQADVDAGHIDNTATIDGSDPSNNPVTATGNATVTTNASTDATFTKTVSPATGLGAGDTATYTFTVKNTGARTLVNTAITDPLVGLSALTCSPTQGSSLAPDATMNCSGAYTVTQADVDNGGLTNTAHVHADGVLAPPVDKDASASFTTDQTPNLSMTKTAAPTAGVVVGNTITYTFTGTNTGTVTLHGFSVTDLLPGLSPISCPAGAVAPLATINCTATYAVTQADVDAGSIINTATITGLDPSNQTVTTTAGATVTADQTASVDLTKTATPTSGLFAGDTVTYTMTATNTGAVSLHDVLITDPMAGLSALSCTPGSGSTLVANATMTCSATYTVTQTDVDAGSISNTATVESLAPNNVPVTDTASRTILAGETASLDLVKTATPSSGVVAGDSIVYGFDVTNTGTVSVTGVSVTDPMVGLGALTCAPLVPAPLAPNATMRCEATYTVTQADVNIGPFTNTATVAGLDPLENPVSATDSATVTPNSVTSIDLTKTVSPDQQVGLGTELTYTMTGTNTGTTTIEGATISDPKAGLSPLSCTPVQGSDLAPGASITCTATYTVTAADVDTGEIVNDATVTGHNLSGQTVSHAAAATVPTAGSGSAGALTLVKKLTDVRDSVATWTITVANVGPGSHAGPFTVTDPLPTDLAAESVSGAGWDCTGTTTITCVHAGDLAAGADTTLTVNTKILRDHDITNIATLDAGGTVLASEASYQPGRGFAFTGRPPSSGFAFTGADAQRLGFLGVLGVLGGWLIMTATRKRNDDEADVVVE